MIDLSERPMYPEMGNCDLFSDARRKTCYERGRISITYSKRLSIFPLQTDSNRYPCEFAFRDGAKTRGHALYNRPLDAHARRRKSRRKDQEASKIFIYFILKSLDFFIEENVVSLFHWALFVLNFDFVSKKYKLCQ